MAVRLHSRPVPVVKSVIEAHHRITDRPGGGAVVRGIFHQNTVGRVHMKLLGSQNIDLRVLFFQTCILGEKESFKIAQQAVTPKQLCPAAAELQ